MRLAAAFLALLLATGGATAQVTLFEHDNYGGARLDVNGDIGDLGNSGFNDRASSVVVHGGTWQLCEHAGYGGRCVTLAPGNYPSLGSFGLNDMVSSIRPLGGIGGRPPPPPVASRPPGGGVRVVLYEGANFTGRQLVVDRNRFANLDGTGFNDRASSLRVERGYWMFCSDMNFEGECRTFGPGDYAQLPPGLNNRISSGRRISDDYPYNAPPNWGAAPGYNQP